MLIFLAEQPTNTISTALVQIHSVYSQFDLNYASSNTPLQERDHPDQDFYQNAGWTHSMIYVMVAYAIGITIAILVLSGSSGRSDSALIWLLIPNTSYFGLFLLSYFPIYTVLTIWVFIMLSILLEDIGCAQGNVLRSVMGITRKNFVYGCSISLFWLSLAGGIMTIIFAGDEKPLFFLCASVAMYCVLSATVCFITIRHRNVFL
jgi:hypothetical protein